MNAPSTMYGIQSSAGAIPVRNEKGEVYMKKVKVQRYISGKRPEYAQYASSEEDSDYDDFLEPRKVPQPSAKPAHHSDNEDNIDDPRLRRLQSRRHDSDDEGSDRIARHRHIHEPEILESEDDDEMEENLEQRQGNDNSGRTRRISLGSDSGESDQDLSDTEIEQRRLRLKQKMLQQRQEEEVLAKEEDKMEESSESESSEYEEESEDEENNEPRLKPLFVRKRDRMTVAEKEKEARKQKELEVEAKKMAKERRRQTLKMVEDSVKKDLEKDKPESGEPNINDVCTDDENDQLEYEAWKLRELKRIKRDREEKELLDRERSEIDRLRNLTEDERKQELRLNPKTVTNKAVKGKYKFLQKYYHRGAFYLDSEDDVLKRDFAQATLEDHFDKTILPKVMQVKNFGRCGRTKYTHLVDQDTTQFDSPWYSSNASNSKFHSEKAGGMKQVFDKPSQIKRKKLV